MVADEQKINDADLCGLALRFNPKANDQIHRLRCDPCMEDQLSRQTHISIFQHLWPNQVEVTGTSLYTPLVKLGLSVMT